jgi:SH3-like domain-containing protein
MRTCALLAVTVTLCAATHVASATTTTLDKAVAEKHRAHHSEKTDHTRKPGHTEKAGHAEKAKAKAEPHAARTRTAEHDKTATKPAAKHAATPAPAATAAKPKAPVAAAASATAAEAAARAAAAAKAPAAPATPADDTPKGSATGLPLPRFASLRSDDVNFRTGPGTRYPIDWVYKRRDLPVEIEREFEVWRLVRAPDGTKDWVHQATLTGRRDVVVTGGERTLRSEASTTAAPVAKLQDGVILRVRSCDAKSAWCRVQVGDYRGWIRREEVWGLEPDEAIGN